MKFYSRGILCLISYCCVIENVCQGFSISRSSERSSHRPSGSLSNGISSLSSSYLPFTTTALHIFKTKDNEESMVKDKINSKIVIPEQRVENTLSNETSKSMDNKTSTLSGSLVLLTVPLAWGTYSPVVKYIYELDTPVPGFVFSLAYYAVASVTLSSILLWNLQKDQPSEMSFTQALQEASNKIPWIGGLELGSYLFIGNCLQVIGLETVPADRASFEVQLTTVLVPLIQGIFLTNIFGPLTRRTLIATLLALTGIITFGFEGDGRSSAIESFSSISDVLVSTSFNGGDFLIVLAAFAYSFHVIRLGNYAPKTDAVNLAVGKAIVETIFSLLLVIGLSTVGLETKFGQEIQTFGSSIGELFSSSSVLPALGSVLWTGWITCAFTIYAQSYGQRTVIPSDANLIYSSQPLFSALFAYLLINETLGGFGVLGGTLIGAAVWLVTSANEERKAEVDR